MIDAVGDASGSLFQADISHTGATLAPPVFNSLSSVHVALPNIGEFMVEELICKGSVPGPFAARFHAAAGQRLLLFGTDEQPSGYQVRSLRLETTGPTLEEQMGLTHPTEPFYAMTFVPNDPDRAFVIAEKGELFSRDFSTAAPFTRVASWALPPGARFVSRLVPVARPSLHLYALSQTGIGRLTDGSPTWQTVCQWPVPDESLLALVAHPWQHDTLFLGTTRGAYRSTNAAASWAPFGRDLPGVPVTDLTIDGSHLYASTFGRGLWRCRP